MISVVTYGRNDTHGYNPHRRTALSLNCIAEVLTAPDDEIIFVDYNSPDELPTLVEALADTLTERCLSLLRVLRVRAKLHEQRFAARTHLPIIEPVARNVAVRRSNPSNRWLLLTNSDMVFVPLGEQSLSEICGELPDGFYGLPRFELPEWLWEDLPRGDPEVAIAAIARMGPDLCLDEITLSHEWIRFDSPGDFQLILRDDFLAIDGLDEEMLLGWHVDANLGKRMLHYRGSIGNLGDRLAGYHCNHLRTQTIYHHSDVANSLTRFVTSVDRAQLPEQRETWGFPCETLEDVRVGKPERPEFASAVIAAISSGPVRRGFSDDRATKWALEYDSGHVLPFLADPLRVASAGARIAYIGANPILEQMLGELVTSLGASPPFTVTNVDDPTAIERLDQTADVVVIDLGVDTSLIDFPLSSADGSANGQMRVRLTRVFDTFRRLVDLERTRLEQGGHPRQFVLVNSRAVYWNAYVQNEMLCGSTTTHSRVRRATVKPYREGSHAHRASEQRAQQLVRWITRRDTGRETLEVRPGQTVEIASCADYAGFGRGWAFPETSAVWTQGPRSELSINPGEHSTPRVLTFSFDEIALQPGCSFEVVLLANGERVAAREFRADSTQESREGARNDPPPTLGWSAQLKAHVGALGDRIRVMRNVFSHLRAVTPMQGSGLTPSPDPILTWRVPVPSDVPADGSIDFVLEFQEPVRWMDARRLGLHLRSLELH